MPTDPSPTPAAAPSSAPPSWRRRLEGLTRRRPLVSACVGVLALCLLLMLLVDKPLALLLKSQVGGEVKAFFSTVTDIGLASHWFQLGAVGLLVSHAIATGTHRPDLATRAFGWVRSWLYLLAVMAASGLLVTVAKHLIGRFRPSLLFREEVYGLAPLSFAEGAHSFPSGHSQAIWGAMGALSVLFPRAAAPLLTLALVVSVSRVALTNHFLSDAVMGSTIGIVTVLALKPLFESGGRSLRLGAR